MNNHDQDVEHDDLPIVSTGGWQVGSVYETDWEHCFYMLDEWGQFADGTKLGPGAIVVCKTIDTMTSGFAGGGEYAILELYGKADNGHYRRIGLARWCAGSNIFWPEQCGFSLCKSPLLALALSME